MSLFKRHRTSAVSYLLVMVAALCSFLPSQAGAATMNDYCVVPPFIAQTVPPLVMFEMGRDHKLYYEAYNDASDLDEDGKLDITYKHTIDYYGYFDPYKCYTYSSAGTGEFNPVSVTSDKFCSAGRWSGNVLNWLNMSRMDSLKKVLYGGHRVTDSNTKTVLERDIMPGDAHSWGKELSGRLCFNNATSVYTYACEKNSDCEAGELCVDKSNNLIGMNASDVPFACSATTAINWSTQAAGSVRVARYYHNAALGDDFECGTDPGGDPAVARGNFLASFDPQTPANFIDQFLATNFDDARLDPTLDHYDHYNTVAVAEFNVTTSADKNSTWEFMIDGNNPVEVEIGVAGSSTTNFTGGTVKASYYGCHAACFPAPGFVGTALIPALCDANQRGTYKPGSTGYHRVIVRHSERGQLDGVKLWYRKSATDTWKIFPSGLSTRTPDITAANVCTIQANQFVALGTPQVTGSIPAKRHLFCGTSLAANQAPILRMITNNSHRKWEWASKESPVCQTTFQDGTNTGAITDYTVRAEVCNATIGLESNCKQYGANYKPVGLLQKYGEGDGTKVCSKVYTKTCNSDSDCDIPKEGMCVDKSSMFFGFMTTSYTKNTSGGVLRKNFGSITDETNLNNGIFQTSENVSGNIIITFDRLSPTVGFDFGAHTYTAADGGTCGWITNGPISEGQCRMWGNPIGEMMYESLRYIAGKGAPTAAFDYSGSQDAGLSISHPAWGYNKGSTWFQPYGLYPSCARPFMLLLSDVNTSFDDDQLPGAFGSSFTEDAAPPLLNMNVSTLADIIGTTEGIAGNNWFIGESSGTANNFVCSSKPVTNLSRIKGICPFEPTKKGSYYAAAVSYYAKTQLQTNTGKPNADTYVVALDSPLANLKVKVGSNFVNILPLGKSVSGGANVRTNCADKCTLTYASSNLTISNCSSTAFCPTNQVVDIYVDDIKYDNSNNVIYASYRINFEDVEQGADHDMDAIAQYEICTTEAFTNGYGTCGTDPGANRLLVKVNNVYGKGGIDQVLGFVISGTTADGAYLVIKDGDVSAADADTPAVVSNLPLSFSRNFTATGTPTGVLKNPLWYAAKWGGFDDIDGDGKAYAGPSCGTGTPDPRCKEWDKDGDGTPDNYFLVANPLKLEDQLNKALLAILTRASSGTAASVLASSEGRGANILQALFHPRKTFDNDTTVDWAGQLLNLWYYIDPRLQTNTIREDTVQDRIERLTDDWQVKFRFDTGLNKTMVDRYSDTNGNGTPDTFMGTVEADVVKSLWEAGDKLFRRTTPRDIKTTLNPPTLMDFSTANAVTLAPYLQAASANEATNIIEYTLGTDKQFCTGTTTVCTTDANCGGAAGSCVKYRSRTVTKGSTTGVWKLGDIVTSTPKLQSPVALNNYFTVYNDSTYSAFVGSNNYKNYGTAYAGANDGMLHAFNFGIFQEAWSGQNRQFEPARLDAADPAQLGSERWAFIPKNILPYLKYLTQNDYCHVFSVDASPVIFDAAINAPAGAPADCTDAEYWRCPKQTVNLAHSTGLDLPKTSWRTVLIGSLRLGGACRGTATACADVNGDGSKDCVNTPVDVSGQSVGYSSYFALDITDQENPKLLWEFSSPQLGYSTAGPAFMRVEARVPNPVDGGATTMPDKERNGRWFVVLASGPTGPVDTAKREFKARSDQNLRLFVLDLKTGSLLRTIDTGIGNAFGGSLLGGKVDYDLDYQDDVLYLGYTKKCAATNNICTVNTWSDGGILRLLTREDLSGTNITALGNTAINPLNWRLSSVIANIGPVTSSVSNLIERASTGTARQGWLYFGTGRYFFRDDDTTNQRILFGVKEPCIKVGGGFDPEICADTNPDATLDFCAAPVSGAGPDTCGDLINVTTGVELDPAVTVLKKGWYINLEGPNNTNAVAGGITAGASGNKTPSAERVMTDPVAVPNGAVFFTTFAPAPNICSFGGNTFLWRLKYDTGSFIPMSGSALLQLSTGEIKELDMKTAFADKIAVIDSNIGNVGEGGLEGATAGRRTGAMIGVPPVGQGLSLVISPTPIDRIIHIKKR
jgi:type IV pilus assembly protein PilY1